KMLPTLEQARKKSVRSFPKIRFFDGAEGVKRAYDDTIRNNPSKELFGFTGTQAIYRSGSVDRDWVDDYIRRRTKAGVKWHSIATDSDESRAMKKRDRSELRITKILPAGYPSALEFATYGDKVIIASFSQHHPLGMIIEDREIAETVKSL